MMLANIVRFANDLLSFSWQMLPQQGGAVGDFVAIFSQ